MRTKFRVHKFTTWLAPAVLILFVSGLIQAQDQTSSQADSSVSESVSKADYAAASAPKPAPTGSTYDWSGAYIGGHIGHGWGKANTSFTPLPSAALFINLAPITLRPDPAGLNAGAQAGYNWQSGKLVFGPEADFSWSQMKGTVIVTPITQINGSSFQGTLTSRQETRWFGTLRGRLGVTPTARVLIYGTAGLAYGRVNYSANSDFRPQGTTQYPSSIRKTKYGWTAGLGVEVAFPGDHWSWKAEYLYYDLRRESSTANPVPANPPFQVSYAWETKAHTFNSGVNFRF